MSQAGAGKETGPILHTDIVAAPGGRVRASSLTDCASAGEICESAVRMSTAVARTPTRYMPLSIFMISQWRGSLQDKFLLLWMPISNRFRRVWIAKAAAE